MLKNEIQQNNEQDVITNNLDEKNLNNKPLNESSVTHDTNLESAPTLVSESVPKSASAPESTSESESVSPAIVNVDNDIPILSIIIPMYNVERYIKTCLKSVCENQSLKNIEIICIDDCSTDNTIVEAQKVAKNDKRIKILKHNVNSGGAGEPRNTGLRISRGKYIAFLDADDMFVKDTLKPLIELADKMNADVIHTERVFFPKDGIIDVDDNTEFTIFSKEEGEFCTVPILETDNLAQRIQMYYQGRFFGWVHNKIYRRDFLMANNIFFDNLLVSEDIVFYFKVVCTAARLVRVPTIMYIYRDNPNSITRKLVSVIESLHSLIQIMAKGTTIMNDFMNKFTFFKEHPDYRWLPIDYLIQQHLLWTQRFFNKFSLVDLEPIISSEFKSYCKEDYLFFTYLFETLHVYRQKIVNSMSAQQLQDAGFVLSLADSTNNASPKEFWDPEEIEQAKKEANTKTVVAKSNKEMINKQNTNVSTSTSTTMSTSASTSATNALDELSHMIK